MLHVWAYGMQSQEEGSSKEQFPHNKNEPVQSLHKKVGCAFWLGIYLDCTSIELNMYLCYNGLVLIP